MKHSYISLYVGDWLKDPALSLCSPATRGVWIDLICRLHELDQGGKITANAKQIARLCRSSDVDIHAALKELQTTNAAEVYERDGVYTVICRRMQKAAELIAKRKQAGSKGGSKTVANRKATPFLEKEKESNKEREREELYLTPAQARARVREFAKSEGISERDADWFFDKCEGNGWTNNHEPIRDWKATIRQWWRTGYIFPSHRTPSLFADKNQITKYGLPLPKGCTIRKDGEVLDYTGRVMDINQVRRAQ